MQTRFFLHCLMAWLALTPEVALADPAIVVEGRVVGPDGAPVAAAHVLGTLEWERQQVTFAVPTLGADGSFVHRIAPGAEKPRAIRVFAYAAGYSNAEEVRTPPRGAPGYQPVTVRLRPTIHLTVQVVDPSGVPVPTAVVTIAQDSWSTEHPLKGAPQPVNAAGTVVFSGVNDKDSLNLVATAPGYLKMQVSPEELGQPVTVQIARGGTVRGRLLDQRTQAPVVGCRLLTIAGDELTTDATGGFQFEAPYGSVTITPSCEDYGTDWDLPAGGLFIPFSAATAGQTHTLQARSNQRISGTVVDGRGRAAAGVQVTRILVPKNPHEPRFVKRGPPSESATTDAQGGFVFHGSAMDEFELMIESPKPWRNRFRFAELKGAIVIKLPK